MKQSEAPDVVLLDVMMPGLDGLATLRALKASRPEAQVIMLSGRNQASTIVEAVRLGAADYVVKPDDPEGLGEIALDVAIKNAIEKNRLVSELSELRQQLSDDEDRSVWGNSEKMRAIATVIEQVADSDVTVLIRGESGVGKGNFYYYFKSKEELGYAIIDRVTQGFVERTLEPIFADSSLDPIAQIHAFLERVLDSHRQRNCVGGCPMGNLASELSDVHEGFRQRLAEIFRMWQVRIAEALTRGKASGRIREECEPADTAHLVVAALEGAILLTKVSRDITVLERCVGELKRRLEMYTN